jgi:protein O-GlcNAc transferase
LRDLTTAGFPIHAKPGDEALQFAAMNDPQFESALRLQMAGDLDGASRILEAILGTDPNHFNARYLLGFIALKHGDFAGAEQHIGAALAINPQSLDALYNHGRALERLGRHEQALAAFDALLALNPRVTVAWNYRGIALLALQRHVEALAAFERALEIEPEMAEAWANRGTAETALGRSEDALASFARSLELRPNSPAALVRHAKALVALDRFETAIPEYERVLAGAPDFPFAFGDYVFAKLNCCEWRALEEERAAILAGIAAGERVVQPGVALTITDSAEAQLNCAEIWAKQAVAVANPLPRPTDYRHDRIRVAYLSADFRDCAVGSVCVGVFEQHDHDRFETIAIALGPDDASAMRARIRSAFTQFIEADRESDRAVAERLRALEVDIAVDMMGYTRQCRPQILAFRPAPVQADWLGYPGTLAVEHIDYILADRVVVPEEHKRFYSEKVVWLPDSYLPYDSSRRPAATRPTRSEAGLPEVGFVFASFNNACKFAPNTFDIWMRLLGAVDGSVLWLPGHGAAMANLKREAERRGIASDRLVFASFTGQPEAHLARLGHADLFLDTAPYGAHSSAADALRAGVPVVTMPGGAFQARVAASLLTAAGLGELVAQDWADYESIARDLAQNLDSLAATKQRLACAQQGPPFDTARFARGLERAFQAMIRAHRAGRPAAHFAVERES